MKRSISVHLGNRGRVIGTLHYNHDRSSESAAFEYAAEWLAAADRFAIEPGLRLVAGPQFHRRTNDGSVFHNVIADAEPDGWAAKVILRDHAKRRSTAKAAGADHSPIVGALDFLLEVDDFSRAGALRFQDEHGVYRRAQEAGTRTAPPLIELSDLLSSTRAVETNSETAADLAYLRGRGTSLQGVRPKCTILDADGTLAIGKFPSVHDQCAVTKGEVLALTLASHAGIKAAKSRIVDSDGTPVALITRFDRREGERLMYASAATLMQTVRGDSREHSYVDLADTIRIHSVESQADIDELWRRIAFSILITNVDDHLHNHGFLHVERQNWRLSPAFDVNPSPDKLRELKTWISEETGPAATIDALMSALPYFGIKLNAARVILGEVEAAVAQWREHGAALGMNHTELEQFADAFEHEERTAAQRESGR